MQDDKIFTVNYLNKKKLAFDVVSYLQAIENLTDDGEQNFIIPKETLSKMLEDIQKNKFALSNHEVNFIQRNPRRTLDYLYFRYRFRMYPKYRILEEFPLHLILEPTSVCNLRCVMCFQNDPTFNQANRLGYMDLNLFQRIVEGGKDMGNPPFFLLFGHLICLLS